MQKRYWQYATIAAFIAIGAADMACAAGQPTPRHYLELRDGEPYSWLAQDGTELNAGLADAKGRAFVTRLLGQAHYSLETANMRWDYSIDDACWASKAADLEACATVTNSVNLMAQERAEQERKEESENQARRREAVAHFREAAAANNDELAWLGPLPAEWSDDEYSRQAHAIFDKMDHDLDAGDRQDFDVANFVCKSPEQFGPVPDWQAVVDYLGSDSPTRPQWQALVEAARKGNWMARVQVFVALSQRRRGDLVSDWRTLQLMSWLQEHHVGALYVWHMDALAGSGYFDGDSPGDGSPVYVYAAMHGSYSAMKRVGDALMGDPRTEKIGKRMSDCAVKMMPVLFTD